MFDWFRNIFDGPKHPEDDRTDMEKITGDMNKVIPFPELKSMPVMPYVDPPKPEKPAQTYYRLGLTDNNRVSFAMGYGEITLSKKGVQNMIEHLAVLRDQLQAETEEE
jgi:hypothetical protein